MKVSRIEIKEINITPLDRMRNIRIYLPPDYDETLKRFPVWYMHDGQNLFDEATSFAGDWKLKVSLDKLPAIKQVIVVGIDNGGVNRLNEYAPFQNKRNGQGGEGGIFLEYIVETLKPYIDKSYRTLSESKNTFMAGSSLGGLISFCAGLVYPYVFGKIGVLSPAFWFNPQVLSIASKYNAEARSRFYICGSKTESKYMEKTLHDTYIALKSGGFHDADIQIIVRDKGQHNEKFWSREFKKMIEWL